MPGKRQNDSNRRERRIKMRIGHTFMIATVLILAITANTYAAEQNHDVTVEPNLPPVTMPSTSVNQLGQVIMAVNDDDIDTIIQSF